MRADIVPGAGAIMSPATTASPSRREPELLGQTVVVIGGSAGIGLETARRARAEGATLIEPATSVPCPANSAEGEQDRLANSSGSARSLHERATKSDGSLLPAALQTCAIRQLQSIFGLIGCFEVRR
jgi:NAD(P)-dependent dehydrogenase (short-subunit alcohol dehydrogenase family)